MTTTMDTSTPVTPSRALHVGLWVTQGLLAAGMLMSGAMKMLTPIQELVAKMAWVASFPPLSIRLIGLAEVLGAFGLILPSALRIMPKLTVAAAGGLFLLMLGAAGTHIAFGEAQMMGPAVAFAAMSAFVAWGRNGKAPIAPRRTSNT